MNWETVLRSWAPPADSPGNLDPIAAALAVPSLDVDACRRMSLGRAEATAIKKVARAGIVLEPKPDPDIFRFGVLLLCEAAMGRALVEPSRKVGRIEFAPDEEAAQWRDPGDRPHDAIWRVNEWKLHSGAPLTPREWFDLLNTGAWARNGRRGRGRPDHGRALCVFSALEWHPRNRIGESRYDWLLEIKNAVFPPLLLAGAGEAVIVDEDALLEAQLDVKTLQRILQDDIKRYRLRRYRAALRRLRLKRVALAYRSGEADYRSLAAGLASVSTTGRFWVSTEGIGPLCQYE